MLHVLVLKTNYILNMVSIVCENCPLRLFSREDKVCIKGYGNVFSKRIIVLPYVDKSAYKYGKLSSNEVIKKFEDVVDFPTGMLQDNHFITSLIKCKETYKIDVTTEIIGRCVQHLHKEIVDMNIYQILLIGNASTSILGSTIEYNVDKIHVINGRAYFSVYNPYIVEYNANKATDVAKCFNRYLDAITTNNFSDYELIYH